MTDDLKQRIGALNEDQRRLLARRLAARRVCDSSARIERRQRLSGVAAASFAQQRLLFIDQLVSDPCIYNYQLSWRLVGDLNESALQSALDTFVERHEVLRTTFSSESDPPRQIIHAPCPVKVRRVDLSHLSDVEREVEFQKLSIEDRNTPFDLAADPMLRAELWHVSRTDHVLQLTMHHIVTDGWSMRITMSELTELYNAFVENRNPTLPELPIQYADFAEWQRDWLSGDVLETQLDYWRSKLADAPSLDLPTDHARPAIQSFRGAEERMDLPRELSDALRTLSQNEDATLFMTLFAAFKVLLHRYSEQDDLVLGTPIANRNRSETESLMGFFVNSLALRTDLSGDPDFRQLLKQVRDTTSGAYEHEDLPFERLVESLNLDRDMSRNPLFQIVFASQNAFTDNLDLKGLEVAPFKPAQTSMIRFDMETHVFEHEEGLRVAMHYCTDLFEAATVVRMLGHYRAILEQIAADPNRRISELRLMTDEQEQRVVVDWNNTSTPYPRHATICELFEQQTSESPDAEAIVFDDQVLTYAQLNSQANQLAHHLLGLGVQPNSLVGLCTERSATMVVGMLGILKAGCAYVPLDVDYPTQRLAFMASDSNMPVVLTQQHLLDRLPGDGVHLVCLDDQRATIEGQSVDNPARTAKATDHAYVIYTSGSTGTPKGVVVPHRAVVRLVRNTDYVQLGPGDRVIQASNASFDAATFEIWGALLTGATLVGVDRDTTLSPTAYAGFLRDKAITTVFVTTALFNQIAREQSNAFATLQTVLFGGERCDPDAARRVLDQGPPQRLLHVYGPTENTTFSTWYHVNDVPNHVATIPVGKPIANTTAYIVDSQMNPVPVGALGELLVGGDGMAREYLNQPVFTQEKFVPNPFGEDSSDRLYKTGDQCRWLEDGSIEFLGRRDQQIKIRGFRVELGEIEAALCRHEAISQAIAMVRDADDLLTAWVVPDGDTAPSSAELRSYLQNDLPPWMVPSRVMVIDEIPLTPNGKVDRRALPETTDQQQSESAYIAPRSETETKVASFWEQLLKTDRVGVLDNFFDLGGHSLLATQLISRIRKEFGIELPLRALFDHPNVQDLATAIDAALWAIDSVKSTGTGPVEEGAI